MHKENVLLKIIASNPLVCFDYAYFIRLCNVTKPSIWPLSLQSICKYSKRLQLLSFSTDLDEIGIKI